MSGRPLRLLSDGRLDDPALLRDPGLMRLLALLNQEGEEARVIGGAVRNSLIGRAVADVDIATTEEPAGVTRRVKAAGLRSIPTGIAHGTVTVLVAGAPYEVTTLRRDVETDGRHAVVRFSRSFREDAERRDFTMNALSVDRAGVVRDAVGGLPDLAAGRVRFIGEADRRVQEDYLRILRFFRFHAAYGLGPPDPEGLAAAERHRDALAGLSRERIRAELLKLLPATGAVESVAAMAGAGIATRILGDEPDLDRFGRLAAIEAARTEVPDAVLRLAALAVRTPGDAERLREGLRLSSAEARRLSEGEAARRHLDPLRPPDRAACLALLFGCGEQGARDGARLAAAEGDADRWRQALDWLDEDSRPALPLGGADVVARGIPPGRTVGQVLKSLQASWIRAGFPREPAALAALLDEAVRACGVPVDTSPPHR